MASVDSGVDTGNDSNDSGFIDKNASSDQMPTNSSIVKNKELHKSGLFDNDDMLVWGKDEDKFKKIELPFPNFFKLEPPAGLSFLHLQPISLSRGYEISGTLQRLSSDYQNSTLINKIKTVKNHYKSGAHRQACLDFTNYRDENRLRLAAFMNDVNKVRKLLDLRVNPNCADYQYRTPLHLSACNGYTDVVRLLLSRGADPNVKDMVGNTPLHLAVCTNHIDVVTLLLKAAFMKVLNDLIRRDMAVVYKLRNLTSEQMKLFIMVVLQDVIDYQLNKGTDASSYNVTGRSPLQLAQSKLKIIQRCHNSEYKQQVTSQVIEMLLTFIEKKREVSKNTVDDELLNSFQTRLQVSETQEQVETELQNLLDNLSNLSLSNTATSSTTVVPSHSNNIFTITNPMSK